MVSELSLLASVILHMILLSSFLTLIGFINICLFFGSDTKEVIQCLDGSNTMSFFGSNTMSYRTSLGRYIDSTVLMVLAALTCDFELRQNS